MNHSKPSDPAQNHSATFPWKMLVLFLLGTLLVYSPAIMAGYIWDDDDYVTQNPTLTNWSGLVSIWADPSATPQYYPLVHTSYWIEYRLWQLEPMGYHLVNVLLHGGNAFLLFLILRQLKMPWAWFAAALYAIHPLNVESVAWVTERKNVLAVLFFCLATLAWMRFLPIDNRDPEEKEKQPAGANWLFYGLTLLAFIGALLSKTVTCMWPVAIVLLYWGAKHRWKIWQLASLTPFFLVGAGMGLLTAYLERKHVGAEGIEWNFSLVEKVMIAGRVFWFYIGKTLLPYPLVFFYPRWEISGSHWWTLSWAISAAVLVVLLFVFRQRLSRWPLAGVLIYAATLFPAMGFFSVYPMRYSFVADHFAYIPFLALMTLAAGLVWQIPREKVRLGIAIGAIAILSLITLGRCLVYEDAEALWVDTLAKNPASCAARINLGLIYMDRGFVTSDPQKISEAEDLFQFVTQCRIDREKGYYHLGLIAARRQEYPHAVDLFRQALEIKPTYSEARYNLAIALNKAGNSQKALEQFRQIEDPKYLYDARLLAGILSFSQEQYKDAEKDFQFAVDQQPDSIEALINLATVQLKLGKLDAAETSLSHAKAIDPYDLGIQRLLFEVGERRR
ncbi:tetratricopeptide repeat protein [bacterium]|nr:tetratricopeptide repeat protein [bacterium]